VSENGGEQESILQDGDLSENGVTLSKLVSVLILTNACLSKLLIQRDQASQVVEENSLNLPSHHTSFPSRLRNPPSSSDSSSSSSSDLDFAPDAPDPQPNHLPPSTTHTIHSAIRKIYDSPKKKSTSFILEPQQGFAEVEVEIEESGQKHMHWLEQENDGEEEQVEKQRNLEDEMDEEENDDYLSKEDGKEKMGSLFERIGDKHEEEEGEREGEMGEKIEEAGEILEQSVTTIQGVVEMEEDEEEEEGGEERQELEEQARQTLANPDLLQQLKDNYRCDCYDDEDQEMVQGVIGGDQDGMGIEGGLNSNSENEEGGGDDSDSLSQSISLRQSQPPEPQSSLNQCSTIAVETESNKVKNLKKEQRKRKKDKKKRAKLAEELERVKGGEEESCRRGSVNHGWRIREEKEQGEQEE